MEKNSKKKIRELTDAAYCLGLQPAQLVRRFREKKLDIYLQFYDGQTETLKSGTGVYEGQWEFPGVDNSNPIRCTIRPGIHPLTAESRDELNIRLDRGDNSISGLLIKLSWKSESIPVDPETLEPLEGEDLKKISGSNLVRVSDRITPLMDNLPRSPRVVLNVGDLKKLSTPKNQAEGTEYTGKSTKKLCIHWQGKSEKLKNLAKLLADHGYIDNPSIWLDHFNDDPIKGTDASPIEWKKTKYELQYLLRNLNYYKIRETHPIHFKDLKPPPWSGNKATDDLDLIKSILKEVN